MAPQKSIAKTKTFKVVLIALLLDLKDVGIFDARGT
jgi:hypothetical protein